MKKSYLLIVLALVLVLGLSACGCRHENWNDADCVAPKTCAECGETEGEALGHSWTDATCEAPKTCTVCSLTEGEALGHDWQDATTELPKTCATCAATEGEKITTDSRFTTAAPADLQGKWVTETTVGGEEMGLEGFDAELTMQVILELGNDGTFGMHFGVADEEAFTQAVIDYTAETLYATLEAEGMTREEADEAMKLAYGMDVKTYAAAAMSGMSFGDIMGMVDIEFVYFVEGDQLYLGESWDAQMVSTTYVLDGDTLTLGDDIVGMGAETTVFTRVTE